MLETGVEDVFDAPELSGEELVLGAKTIANIGLERANVEHENADHAGVEDHRDAEGELEMGVGHETG